MAYDQYTFIPKPIDRSQESDTMSFMPGDLQQYGRYGVALWYREDETGTVRNDGRLYPHHLLRSCRLYAACNCDDCVAVNDALTALRVAKELTK